MYHHPAKHKTDATDKRGNDARVEARRPTPMTSAQDPDSIPSQDPCHSLQHQPRMWDENLGGQTLEPASLPKEPSVPKKWLHVLSMGPHMCPRHREVKHHAHKSRHPSGLVLYHVTPDTHAWI